MKHNEVKAYFKKQLVEALPKYDVLSIDETLSSRNIYIIDNVNYRVAKVSPYNY